ncbi:hypothetical protein JTE90_005458 [Oedothorax gibbosus]|uniref:Mitochondrial assembly of ribosomal large subunit protein 1 n=1 Tax=Oedothorax gibbosus TaxID=931172 RepID=A0AAV6U4Z5_9ARAC|nr:hypothetical protein JTE90_005458 [Oedothorax gibbosus]
MTQHNPIHLKDHHKHHDIQPEDTTVFSSNLQKSDVNSTEDSGEVPSIDIANDEEFQNILKDFSLDFNVIGENEKVLDDIKKSLDEYDDTEKLSPETSTSTSAKFGTHSAIDDKYKKFSDADSVIIPSYEELKTNKYSGEECTYHIDQDTEYDVDVSQIPAKRGITGVFDIDEMVEVLRKEKLMDIAVISVPKELHYTDFLVLATARSPRHSDAVAEHLIKLHKMKKHRKDPFVQFEGEKKSNWKALDMGNIVLHIFLEETRTYYDIESLWLFDSEFDSGGTLKPDPLFDAIEEQMAYFSSLQDPTSKEGT